MDTEQAGRVGDTRTRSRPRTRSLLLTLALATSALGVAGCALPRPPTAAPSCTVTIFLMVPTQDGYDYQVDVRVLSEAAGTAVGLRANGATVGTEPTAADGRATFEFHWVAQVPAILTANTGRATCTAGAPQCKVLLNGPSPWTGLYAPILWSNQPNAPVAYRLTNGTDEITASGTTDPQGSNSMDLPGSDRWAWAGTPAIFATVNDAARCEQHYPIPGGG